MKKFWIGIGVIIVLGVGYWLVSPFWRTEKVSEALPAPASDVGPETANELVEIKSGVFTGFDSLHTGSGTPRLIKKTHKT